MGIAIRFGQMAPTGTPQAVATPPQVRFGRDELFVRNDRFESVGESDQPAIRALKDVLAQKKPSLQQVRDASAILYNAQGRLRGKGVADLAQQAALKEVQAAENAKATKTELALSRVKLANAMLAADREDKAAYQQLQDALDMLKDAGFKPADATQRQLYAHGLYNRGTWFMNNPLYKETAQMMGPVDMMFHDALHEGLTLFLHPDSPLMPISISQLEEGLPFIEEAILLADQIQDKKVSKAEYMTAKGEVLHLLAHLESMTPTRRRDREDECLATFRGALDELEAVPPQEQTAQHTKLIEKIATIKIPHLCNHPHDVADRGPGCAVENTRATSLMKTIIDLGIPTAPDTQDETDAKVMREEHLKTQERLDRLAQTDPQAYMMAVLRMRMGYAPFDD